MFSLNKPKILLIGYIANMETIEVEGKYKTVLSQTFPEVVAEAILAEGKVRVIEEGETLAQPQKKSHSAFIVLSGKVKVYRLSDEGSEFFLYYLQPKDACAVALSCAIHARESAILAKAVEKTEVLVIPAERLNWLMSQHRPFFEYVIDTFKQRFDELLEVLDQVAFRSLDEKLSYYLRKNSEALNTKLLNVSHQQIAEELHSSREVISRLLKKMENEGLVTLYRGQIELHFQ